MKRDILDRSSDEVLLDIAGGPWSKARRRLYDKDAQAELDSLVNAKMIAPETAKSVMEKQKSGEVNTPMDALSEDPKFLNKVFQKKK